MVARGYFKFVKLVLLAFGPGLLLGACGSTSMLVGAGAQTPAIAKLSSSPDASAAILAPLYYPISARVQTRNSRSSFYSSLDFNPYPHISPEKGIHQFHGQLRFGVSPPFATIASLKVFLVGSAHMNWQRGLGKAVLLGNGESISVFYTPGSNKISQTLNLGAELALFLNETWMITSTFLAEAPFSSARRQSSALVSLWYKWGGQSL